MPSLKKTARKHSQSMITNVNGLQPRSRRRRRRLTPPIPSHSEDGSPCTGGVSIESAIPSFVNRFAPSQVKTSMPVELPLVVPSRPDQLVVAKDNAPSSARAAPVIHVRRRRRRVRARSDRLRDVPSSLVVHEATGGQHSTTGTEITREPVETSDTSNSVPTPQTALSGPANPLHRSFSPRQGARWADFRPSAALVPLPTTAHDHHRASPIDQPPFGTGSNVLHTDTDRSVPLSASINLLRSVLPNAPQAISWPDEPHHEHTSASDLEDTFHSITSADYFDEPRPANTPAKRSRFFHDRSRLFNPPSLAHRLSNDLVGPREIGSRRRLTTLAVPPLGGWALSQRYSTRRPNDDPWELTLEEAEVLDHWKRKWQVIGRVRELVCNDLLGQEWIEDDAIWADLGLPKTRVGRSEGEAVPRASKGDRDMGILAKKKEGEREKVRRAREAVGEWVMVKKDDGSSGS